MRGEWIGRHSVSLVTVHLRKLLLRAGAIFIFLKQYKLYPVCQNFKKVTKSLQVQRSSWAGDQVA